MVWIAFEEFVSRVRSGIHMDNDTSITITVVPYVDYLQFSSTPVVATTAAVATNS